VGFKVSGYKDLQNETDRPDERCGQTANGAQ
jgi:hypothetical protein